MARGVLLGGGGADQIQVDLIIKALTEGFQTVAKDIKMLEGDIVNSSSQANKETEKQASKWSIFKDQITAVAGAYYVAKQAMQAVINVGKQVVEILDTAQVYQRSQTALAGYTGSVDMAEEAMIRMTIATGGALDKLSAAQMAAKFFSMDLATSTDEAALLAEMAITLGAAMGKGPQKAFEDFSMLLANKSIWRLDNFGISSGTVRTRIKELTDSMDGMNRETAFMIATLEVGTDKMNQLKDAGFETATSWDVLKAKWNNWWLDVKVGIADGLMPAIDNMAHARDRIEEMSHAALIGSDSFNEYAQMVDRLTLANAGVNVMNYEVRKSEAEKEQAIIDSMTATEDGEDSLEAYIQRLVEARLEEAGLLEETEKMPEAIKDASNSMLEFVKAVDGLSAATVTDPFAGLDMSLSSSIESALEAMDFEELGGREASKAFAAVKVALASGRITPEEARTFFEALYLESLHLEQEMGNMTFIEARNALAEAFGIPLQEAAQLLENYQDDVDAVSYDDVLEKMNPWMEGLKEGENAAYMAGRYLNEMEYPNNEDYDDWRAGLQDGANAAYMAGRYLAGLEGDYYATVHVNIQQSGNMPHYGNVPGDPSAPGYTNTPTPPVQGSTGSSGGQALNNENWGENWARGGMFDVPIGYPNDSYGPLWVESGERVVVMNKKQQRQGGVGGNVNMYGPVTINQNQGEGLSDILSMRMGR